MPILAFILRSIANWISPAKNICTGECTYIIKSDIPKNTKYISKIDYNQYKKKFEWSIFTVIGYYNNKVAEGWAVSEEIANELIDEYLVKLGLK